MTYTHTFICRECGYKKTVTMNTCDCCLPEDVITYNHGWIENDDGTWTCQRCYDAMEDYEKVQ